MCGFADACTTACEGLEPIGVTVRRCAAKPLPTLPVTAMDEPTPHSKTPRPILFTQFPLPLNKPAKYEEPEPVSRYLAGYVLKYRVALRLESTLTGEPMVDLGPHKGRYPLTFVIQNKITEHLERIGLSGLWSVCHARR